MSIPTALTPPQAICRQLSATAQKMADRLRKQPNDHLVDFFTPAATRGDSKFPENDNNGPEQTATIISPRFGFGSLN